MRRPLEVTTADVLDHYHNRRMLPMDIATYLTPEEVESVRPSCPTANLGLRPVYLRFYPNGTLAAHIIGYSGKTGGQAHGPLQPNELLWPDLEGREGLEKTFNEQLTGKPGVLNMTFDGKGNKTSERIVSPPDPRQQRRHHARPQPPAALRAEPRQGRQARGHGDDGPRQRRRAGDGVLPVVRPEPVRAVDLGRRISTSSTTTRTSRSSRAPSARATRRARRSRSSSARRRSTAAPSTRTTSSPARRACTSATSSSTTGRRPTRAT